MSTKVVLANGHRVLWYECIKYGPCERIKYRVGTILLISTIVGLSLALMAKGHQGLVPKHRKHR